MSLKAFHVVFVLASVVLAAGVGVWSVEQARAAQSGYWLLAGLSFLAAGALVVYGVWFLKKNKDVSYL